MRDRERLFQAYCDTWVREDASTLEDYFTPDVVYTESDGSRYEGITEIRRWFAAWLTRGKVLAWDVLGYVHQGGVTAAEWRFLCRYDGVTAALDGVKHS
ncbi:MAG: nuclear transport factor 2 family protein [Eubacteriales bacterium]|nr:nuclear transport factor 2 family protein [Eubacteriales bacterium]